MNRIAGVPKTAAELEADRLQLEEARTREAQRQAGVYPSDQPSRQPAAPSQQQQQTKPHADNDHPQREKA